MDNSMRRRISPGAMQLVCGALVICGAGLQPASAGTSQAPSTSTSSTAGPAAIAREQPVLPPIRPWNGRSRSLIAKDDDPWITPAERSGLTRTPRYDETITWLKRLDEASPHASMVSLGKSPEGRDIWMVVATAEGAATPGELRKNGRPTLLAQAGIHAGEIDGKDAGMMLLRDMTVRGTKRSLLEAANFLFIPIFNVDGHERFSRFGRINQRGPVECGWRTTATNLNLNREYAVADAPEMKCLIRALNAWEPDLYFDIHVTDGADYQYDVTYGYSGEEGYSPEASRWMDRVLTPTLNRDLQAMGHIPGPLVFPVDDDNLSRGIVAWMSGPGLSTGYGTLRHLPTVLVENHSLKPYEQRVLGTYVLLESVLKLLGRSGRDIQAATRADRERRPAEITLQWKHDPTDSVMIDFLGIESRRVPSAISGGLKTEWTGKPVTLRIPHRRHSTPAIHVTRPQAYWIPVAWTEVIDRLALHGIQMERIDGAVNLDAEVYRIRNPKFDTSQHEGRIRVKGETVVERREVFMPPGSVRVSTDQPLGDLAAVLLEPDSPDSYFQWGLFNAVLQQTEYVEGYVMEPIAERMLAADSALKAEFEAKVASDTTFAHNPRARLYWFYRRTPFWDDSQGIYPVARDVEAGGR